jgi:hypothetical protein
MNSSSMEVGPIGIWTAQFDYQPAAKVREAAAIASKVIAILRATRSKINRTDADIFPHPEKNRGAAISKVKMRPR